MTQNTPPARPATVNTICQGCLSDCPGTTNKIYSGCIYRQTEKKKGDK